MQRKLCGTIGKVVYMDISVIIPVYNRANMITNALDSLKNQTISNFDVIIVDDGSYDDLQKVISEYTNELNIKYIHLSHSGNIAFLRNCGLKASSSKYIAILDSDDWCVPERLEKQLNFMNKNENIDILSSWVILNDEIQDENTKRLEWLYNMNGDENEIIIRCLNDGCCICNSTVMMKKSRIDELGGYDERMHICEDFNLWLRAFLNNYDIKIMKEKLVVRKLHKQSVTEGYNGAATSIRLVIKNKIEFLKATFKLEGEIYIWGINSRNSILLDELKAVIDNENMICIIDIYNEMPRKINKNAYHLVTTFSRRDDVFEYLKNQGLKIVENFIYA